MMKPLFTSLPQAVETYYDELRQFVRWRTGSPWLADDVVQETWIRARTACAGLPENPRAYLYRMVGNLAVDYIRRHQRWEKLIGEEGENGGSEENQWLVNPIPDPVDVAISQQEFTIFCRAVRELPNKCREVFMLYHGHGLTMREVAAMRSISAKTVDRHIARAKLRCRERLQEAGRNI